MEELRVPKHAVPVEIRFAGGTTAAVEVFLAELADRSERLSDLLEGDPAFLPARESGETVLLRRDAIAVARVSAAFENGGLDAAMTPTEAKVQVLLTDGSSLEGLLRYVAQPARARVLDHLNEPARFFAVWNGDVVALVARAHVARVTPL